MSRTTPNLDTKSIVNFLNLPEWLILDVIEEDDRYIVTARPASDCLVCPSCGQAALVKHGTDAQVIRDLPAQGKQVVIHVVHQRYRCKRCRKTCFQRLPNTDEKRWMTERLVRHVERKAITAKRTFANLAEEIGVTPRTIRYIFDDYAAMLDRTVQRDTPAILGIDELHLLGVPRGIITDLEANTVVDLLADRRKPTIIHYLQHLTEPGRVRVVVIDMWKPYREAVQQILPDAVIVADKFHVTRYANLALESLRKEISAGLSRSQRKTLKMQDRFLLLRRKRDLTPEQRFLLESWTENIPLLGQAYDLKERFYAIWDEPDRQHADVAYIAWMESIPPALQPTFLPLLLTIEEWGDQIFAYFEHRITGGFVEGANGIARVLNRMGRGYSLPVLRARLLYGMNGYSSSTKRKSSEESVSVGEHGKGVSISTLVAQGKPLDSSPSNTTDST